MTYIVVGLGNPGDEYKNTRHNAGRIFIDSIRKKFEFSEWKKDSAKLLRNNGASPCTKNFGVGTNKRTNALVSNGKIGKSAVVLVEPETGMNKSGDSVSKFITNAKKARELIVIHDDVDLPIGSFKILFNRGSGGHKGLESVMRKIKTKEFVRIKIGVSPITPSGKIKKPKGEQKVVDLILSEFKEKEFDTIKKLSKKVCEALEMIVLEGKEKAMNRFN